MSDIVLPEAPRLTHSAELENSGARAVVLYAAISQSFSTRYIDEKWAKDGYHVFFGLGNAGSYGSTDNVTSHTTTAKKNADLEYGTDGCAFRVHGSTISLEAGRNVTLPAKDGGGNIVLQYVANGKGMSFVKKYKAEQYIYDDIQDDYNYYVNLLKGTNLESKTPSLDDCLFAAYKVVVNKGYDHTKHDWWSFGSYSPALIHKSYYHYGGLIYEDATFAIKDYYPTVSSKSLATGIEVVKYA